MPATSSSIDADLVAAFRAGDERALERAYRAAFPALTTAAGSDLGDMMGAPRMVERTFLEAWAVRSRFDTPEALDSFLRDTLHASCVKEKSRLAALHRFEANEGVHVKKGSAKAPPSVDESWSHVRAKLHPDAADPHAAEESRHLAAQHVAQVAKRPSWALPVVILVVILAVVAAVNLYFNRMSADAATRRVVDSEHSHFVKSNAGQRGDFTLADSTKVTIGSESQLRIPNDFGGTVRALRIEGTAAFDVAPHQAHPFQVIAGNTWIDATGTKFEVRAFPAESLITVRVRDGDVNVRAGKTIKHLAAGQAVSVDHKGAMRDPSTAEVDEALGWTDGRFVANQQRLGDVVQELRRWYTLNLVVKDPALLDRRVTVSAPLDSSHAAITQLEQTGNLKFGYEQKTMVLTDAAAGAKPQ